MSFNKFPYTNYNDLNLDYLLNEVGNRIPKPENAEDGQVLRYNAETNEWEAGSAQGGVPASEVTMTAQTIINTTNVQAGMAKINTEFTNRPVKGIRLNNVPVAPDANGIVNIQVPDGNNILY